MGEKREGSSGFESRARSKGRYAEQSCWRRRCSFNVRQQERCRSSLLICVKILDWRSHAYGVVFIVFLTAFGRAGFSRCWRLKATATGQEHSFEGRCCARCECLLSCRE